MKENELDFVKVVTSIKTNEECIRYLCAFLNFSQITRTKFLQDLSYYRLTEEDMLACTVNEDRPNPVIKFEYDMDEELRITSIKIVTNKKVCKGIFIDHNEWVWRLHYFATKMSPKQMSLDLKEDF